MSDPDGSTNVAQKKMRLSFTKRRLEGLKPKGTSRFYVYDTDTKGLSLAIHPSGQKVFFLYRRIDRRPERILIGPFPDLSIEQARGITAGYNSEIALGKNPARTQAAIRSNQTLQELFDRYLEEHAKPYKRVSSVAADEWLFGAYLATWKHRQLFTIRRRDVQTLHARIGREHGHYAANHMLSLLRHMFNKAAEWGWEGDNPCRGVKKFDVLTRERFLGADELPRFFTALTAQQNRTFRDFVLMCLLTGARRANVQGMRWEDINFEGRTWTIPAAVAKGRKQQRVALVPVAVDILRQRKADLTALAQRVDAASVAPATQRQARRLELDRTVARNGTEWVFPTTGASGHYIEPKRAWATLLKTAEIKDLHVHDLRRTLGSWQAALGANLAVIKETLGHRDISTTMIYAHLNLDPIRQAMEQATAAILTAGGLATSGEVVAFPTGGQRG